MTGAHKDHGAHCDGCLMLGYVVRAERAEAALAAVGEALDSIEALRGPDDAEWWTNWKSAYLNGADGLRALLAADPVSLADVRACTSCGQPMDSPPCQRDPLTGRGGHTFGGGKEAVNPHG